MFFFPHDLFCFLFYYGVVFYFVFILFLKEKGGHNDNAQDGFVFVVVRQWVSYTHILFWLLIWNFRFVSYLIYKFYTFGYVMEKLYKKKVIIRDKNRPQGCMTHKLPNFLHFMEANKRMKSLPFKPTRSKFD